MTAAELSQLWEPIAARCPELRPDAMVGRIPVRLHWSTLTDGFFWKGDDPDRPAEKGVSWGHPMPASSCANLWRDAAVRFLATRRNRYAAQTGYSLGYADGLGWVVREDADDGDNLTDYYPAPDHALAAAVAAVLGAKESKG